MKAIICKKICKNDTLPKSIIIDKIEIDDAKVNSEKCNEFFVNEGPNLASENSKSDISFKSFIAKITTH